MAFIYRNPGLFYLKAFNKQLCLSPDRRGPYLVVENPERLVKEFGMDLSKSEKTIEIQARIFIDGNRGLATFKGFEIDYRNINQYQSKIYDLKRDRSKYWEHLDIKESLNAEINLYERNLYDLLTLVGLDNVMDPKESDFPPVFEFTKEEIKPEFDPPFGISPIATQSRKPQFKLYYID